MRKGTSYKEQYASYSQQLKRIKNRKDKLARHLKKYPNDAQAQAATLNEGTQRDKSSTKGCYPSKQFVLRDAAGHVIQESNFTPSVRGKQ